MTLSTSDDFIPSIRGLILSRTRTRQPIHLVDLQRWLQHLRIAHGIEKADLLADSLDTATLAELIAYARDHDVALSLRTSCDDAVPPLKKFRGLGLHDLHLTPAHIDHLNPWLAAAQSEGIDVLIQLTGPPRIQSSTAELAKRWANANVRVVRFVLHDPLVDSVPARSAAQAQTMFHNIQAISAALREHDMDVTLEGIPFCVVAQEHRGAIVNTPQRPYDHNGYDPASNLLAQKLHRRTPWAVSRILKALLARDMLHEHPADNLLLPWLLDRRTAHITTGIWTRLTRGRRLFNRGTASLPPSRIRYEREKAAAEKQRAQMNPQCVACSLRRICDGPTQAFREAAPGMAIHAQPGDLVLDPLHFARSRARYFDPIDDARRQHAANEPELAEAARKLLLETSPALRIHPKDYGIENAYFERFEGGLKWFVVEPGERDSTPLATLSPPFMLAVDVGGGLAEWFGFRIGRSIRIAAPMIAYRHTFALYANDRGEYVILRDGGPVRPAELEGTRAQPHRLPEHAELRLCAVNIEDVITTYNVRLWTGEHQPNQNAQPAYSVIIVSTRFTRRLQAVLRSLAHQTGVDASAYEVLVCYVPGIDATDDLLDNIQAAYPNLRVVRKPFPPRKEHAKGFMINEAGHSARGDWIVLLDADTLLPPDFFARLNDAPNNAEFIAPDGRKLLPPDLTAQILLGEIQPWNEWRALLDGPGDYRRREAKGVPVGFCQIFRAHWLRDIPYAEYEHFEWADMAFGKALIQRTGKPHRLSGAPVLHLDHGSSQWFGTKKHY